MTVSLKRKTAPSRNLELFLHYIVANKGIGLKTNAQSLDYRPILAFCLAQESLSVTVLLNTRRSGVLS